MRTRIRAYALVAAALVLAMLLRALLDRWLGDALPLVTAFAAVAAAVWAAGWLAAAVIAVTAYFACSYLFIPPRHTFLFGSFADVVGMIAYLFTCGLIIGIGQAMRAAKLRANRGRDTLRVTLASIGDAVITTNTKGRVTYLNAVASSLTGWTEREAIGQPLLQPDAVLLDIGLPKLNGYEVCRRMREHRWGEALLIVALTGWGQDEDRQRSVDAGFDTHLVKPVDHDILMKLLLMKLLASLPSRPRQAEQSGIAAAP